MTRALPLIARANLVCSNAIGNRLSDPLPRLLALLILRAGSPVAIDQADSRPWASALFEGRRHVIRLRFGGPDAIERRLRFGVGLEEAEWALPGHFVADISIDGRDEDAGGPWLDLSALTIQDW